MWPFHRQCKIPRLAITPVHWQANSIIIQCISLQQFLFNVCKGICHSQGRNNARPLLSSLHWLPVRQRVTYKLVLLTPKVRTTAALTYLSELVQIHAPPRVLHSCDAPLLVVPRMHTKLAHRTFSVAAPSSWNSLPADMTVQKHSHFQTSLENPSVQTHIVLPCCHKCLCISGPKGAMQMRYHYYY